MKNFYKNPITKIMIFFLSVTIVVIISEGCSKFRSSTKAELMINDYYQPLKTIVGSSYDYALKNIISGTQVQLKTGAQIISPFISPEIQNAKVISINDPNSSQEYQNFYSNYVNAIRSSSLKSHDNFFNFGISEIQKLTNEEEKKSAAFLIALGTSSFEYLTINSEKVTKTCNILADEKTRNKYIDPNTGLLQMNIIQSASTLKVIAVIIVVVAAAVLAYGAAVTWAVAETTAGGLGLLVGSNLTVAVGVIGGLGAGIGAYVGTCPPILGNRGCGLT